VSDLQITNEKPKKRASRKIFTDSGIEYKIEELIKFQGEVVESLDAIINKLNLNKLFIMED